ncbi:MAG: transcription elongation factor GreA [Termitinemataceae bacterium]|nr:MAG: transcription elongation factor GreA [Termitinemataceae bacterium]
MSEALLKKVQNMLNEEKFTRATLSNYSIDRFKELDEIVNEAKKLDALDELKDLCNEHLTHTKNSIIAVYFSGIAALSQQIIDDAVLINLVSIFIDNKKSNIVRYLCERILDIGESKFALRTLIDCYKTDNETEKLIDVWQRLVVADPEEADIAKILAERAEKAADLETAVDYFKKAIHRYINKQLFTNVREIWLKLLEYQPDDIEYFLNVQARVAKNISTDKAAFLLEDVYASCKKRGSVETGIAVLKIILTYDEKDNQARKEITESLRQKYSKHSLVEEYIKISNLTQGWRNVHEAINDFEKHIAFDKGNYVFHRTWGVGRIAKVEGDTIVIDFSKKRAHSMSLKMAVNALQTLTKDHIWVLRVTLSKDELHEKVKGEIDWALKTVIKSFGNSCDIKRIKAELVPAVLTVGEWTSWVAKAKEILKTDLSFGVSPDNINIWTVREHPVESGEKLFTEFKAEKKFYKRVDIIRTYSEIADIESDDEYFGDMLNFFYGYLKTTGQTAKAEYVFPSYLLIKELAVKHPFAAAQLQLNFSSLFESVSDICGLFLSIKDNKLRDDFLEQIKVFVSDWQNIHLKLFPVGLNESIIDNLKVSGCEDKIVTMIRNCFENYKDNRAAVVWFYKNYREQELFQKACLSHEKIIITLINVLDVTYREIDNHQDTSENKKINKQVLTILFKDGILDDYIDNSDRESIIRVWTLLDDVKDLDPAVKLKLKERVIKKYPDFKFYGAAQKDVVVHALIVTMAKHNEKQRELDELINVEVPKNSKELDFALSLGDLKENAEFKAAKERQAILNSTISKLQGEIDRAQLFDPSTINTQRVSFGTVVTLLNETKNVEEVYTILGPWESDPTNKIISYRSPFGDSVMNKRVGEHFVFSINNDDLSYEVKDIKAAVL